MDMVLRRLNFRQDGILGELVSDDQTFECATLEHAYTNDNGNWEPKLPIGLYLCRRGKHTLEHHAYPFEAFEIMNVPNHTNILFHVGNFNNDSQGCVLLGEKMNQSERGSLMIGYSKSTFDKFMNFHRGVEEFNLTVINYPSQVGRD